MLLAGAGIAALMIFPPNVTPWYPPCTFRAVTGYHCPGCGMTRALHALLNGHFLQALAYNPFIITPLAWLVWEMIALGVCRTFGYRKSAPANWAIWTFVAILILFGFVRNLPWEPFTLLAPHEIQ